MWGKFLWNGYLTFPSQHHQRHFRSQVNYNLFFSMFIYSDIESSQTALDRIDGQAKPFCLWLRTQSIQLPWKLIHLNSGRLSMRAKKPKPRTIEPRLINTYFTLCKNFMVVLLTARRPEMVNYWEGWAQWAPRVVFTVAIFTIAFALKLNNTKHFQAEV